MGVFPNIISLAKGMNTYLAFKASFSKSKTIRAQYSRSFSHFSFTFFFSLRKFKFDMYIFKDIMCLALGFNTAVCKSVF